ncbi:HAMP domain-containing histidine kinase [Hyphomicrobiales bacterium BP6-180914]|uniref:histidine kinase n=1 Tax=Lichenifustis flavocetrariae TaxID=2949735 RepID=A0AA41YT40_9HYPH|nr:HAMP domain-containing sensor histidine kinase [Lichenifustis flavocetrariae]MCW6506532.1 HAMP domain-containing histidine kinase [Lichenifustis flavocetrariae]
MRRSPERNALSLSKVFRTTAFKLSVAYLVIFAIGSAFVLGGVAWNVNGLLNEQITQTIQAEITGLAEQYEVGGIRQLVEAIDRRTRLPGSSLYLVTNYAGEPITGNVGTLPAGVIERTGLLVETPYGKPNETKMTHLAVARIFQLPGGFRLLVGRDLEERENLRTVMTHALVISLLWLVAIGLVGGLFVARRVLRRVDAMNATARTIMATGDMTRRLPIAGTGDELDRLAANLNALIARIGTLMAGMKEVSDNIAHDLRTPLTRLRNGAEEALRHEGDSEDYRAALNKVIAESDGLIGIFNALLMIARAEAGSGREGMTAFDAGEVARDVAELYEPVAEDQEIAFAVEAADGLHVRGSRELLSQALANLVDNALKYGLPESHSGPGEQERGSIAVTARREGRDVTISVADHGPGIAEIDRARVFDRFVRLEGARSRPGSGLGLSLAAAIARLHGGTLEIGDNAPGLRITLRLPAVDNGILALPGLAQGKGEEGRP